jgi:chromosomal replication initiation ATPase DnaA
VNLKAPSYRLSLSLLNKSNYRVAKSVVEKFVKNVKREISIDYIQKIVSDYFQLDLETLQSKQEKETRSTSQRDVFAKNSKASLANIGSQIEIVILYYMLVKQLIILLPLTNNSKNLLRYS